MSLLEVTFLKRSPSAAAQREIQAVTSGDLSASEDATSRAKFCPSTLPRKLETKMARQYPNGEYFLATRNQDMESSSHRKGGFKRSIRMAEIEEVSFDQQRDS